MEPSLDMPPRLQDLRRRVDHELEVASGRVVDRARAAHPDLVPLADEVRGFVAAGGKRLRPLLVMVGYEAAGGDPEDVLDAAVAVEFVHTCALVHDDLIDRSDARRGRPSSHAAFAAWADGWSERPDRFGEAAAVLAGDLAHAVADEAFLRTPVPPERLLDAFGVFVTMREEVTGGQFLDVVSQHRGDASTELALTVAERKSGLYSVARPLEIGALLAGDRDSARTLTAVGVPLGIAFQLRDDILGVFGTEAATGKSVRSDLAEGKRTYLVAATLERLHPEAGARFRALLGRPDLDEDGAEELRETMRSSGGLRATERRTEELLGEALELLDRAELPEASREVLGSLARFLVRRRS